MFWKFSKYTYFDTFEELAIVDIRCGKRNNKLKMFTANFTKAKHRFKEIDQNILVNEFQSINAIQNEVQSFCRTLLTVKFRRRE
jgi:hypothetical protein